MHRSDPNNSYPSYPSFSHEIKDAVAMATKDIQFYKNGDAPFITVSNMPEPYVVPKKEEVHLYHYHGRNGHSGSPRTAPIHSEPAKTASYVVIGTLAYGRLTAIDPMRSTPGISGVPSRVTSELMSVYGNLPTAMVIIMNNNGKFTIQAQLIGEEEQQSHQQFANRPPTVQFQPPPQQLALPPQRVPPHQNMYAIPPPIIYREAPRRSSPTPSPRRPVQVIYVDEDLRSLIDIEEDSASSDDDDRRHRRGRKKDDGRSHLQRKYSELYREERDDRTRRDDDRTRRDDDRRRDRRSDDRRDKNVGRDTERTDNESPKPSKPRATIYAPNRRSTKR